MNRLAALLLLATPAQLVAQRPWVGLEVAGTHWSVRSTGEGGMTSDETGAGIDVKGRIGWRFLSVAVSHDRFAVRTADRTAKSMNTAWSIDPRLTSPAWGRAAVYAEYRFAATRHVMEGFLLGGPIEGRADGSLRAYGGGLTLAITRHLGAELGLSLGRLAPGNLLIDGFDVGFVSTSRPEYLTTRFGAAVRF